MGQRRTGFNTGFAESAVFQVSMNARISELQDISRATVDALFAAYASVGKTDDFNFKINALWVMAPMAIQRAAFEEYSGPDVRSIVDRISFNGKNCRFYLIHSSK